MSSTLCIRKAPEKDKGIYHFKIPIKQAFAKRFGEQSGKIEVGPSAENIAWIQGIIDVADWNTVGSELEHLKKILDMLENGSSVEIWWEY